MSDEPNIPVGELDELVADLRHKARHSGSNSHGNGMYEAYHDAADELSKIVSEHRRDSLRKEHSEVGENDG